MRLTSRLVAAFAATVLITAALAGCRSDSEGPSTDDAGIKTDFGVTSEPCPEAIDETKGCIYLGTLSDLTVGPFQPLAVPIVAAQKAFWNRVNEAGGIGGYEIDVTTYVGDNKYDPQVTTQVYQEMKPDILALAQTLGSPTTAAILPDLKASSIVAAPAAWTSAYAFEDVILESGASYCYESMNAVEFATSQRPNIAKVMAVHYPGDYGDDAAAGAQIAAEELGFAFTDVPTGPGGGDAQTAAIAQIVTERPELVILTTGPTEAATIVGGVALQAQTSGYAPLFIGTSPTWNPALLGSPAAPALTALYLQSGPWGSWGSDTPGHEAMREALGEPDPLNDGYTAGWVWSYPLKAALEKAAENKDLTRAGLLAAAKSLTAVDYEGMLPSGAGNYADGPAGVVKATQFSKPDASQPTGVAVVQPLTVGDIAEGYELTQPCYETLS